MSKTREQVQRWVEQNRMVPWEGRVIAALSGGADSMAMVHLLLSLFPRERILCAHVNHGIRGAEADEDEAFVREWCSEQGIELRVLQVNVPEEAARSGEGLEACGRRLRYEFLESLLSGDNDRIATAHTRSDQAETVLLHLLQGAGARGLSGIAPVRGNIIRPVLLLSREEIEAYCRENGIPWRTDSTNACLDYTRNRLRHQVLPLLCSIQPETERLLARTAETLRRDADCLDDLAEELLSRAKGERGWSVSDFREAPEAVSVRALDHCFRQAGCPRPETVHLEQALECLRRGRGRVDLPGNVELNVWREVFTAEKKQADWNGWELPAPEEKTLLPDGRVLILEVFPVSDMKKRIKFHNLLFPNLMDYDTITHSRKNWKIRTRRGGDRFEPAGRGVTKTLKKLFSESRVPTGRRDSLLLLETEGEILWLEGFGVCQRCRLTSDTRQVLLAAVLPEETAFRSNSAVEK